MAEVTILENHPGTGAEIKKGALVFCHFVGRLEDGTIFDRTTEKPFESVVGSKKVIQGWSQGLMGAREGGRRTFTVPAELAYADRGASKIPPNSNLIYDVEILEVRNRE